MGKDRAVLAIGVLLAAVGCQLGSASVDLDGPDGGGEHVDAGGDEDAGDDWGPLGGPTTLHGTVLGPAGNLPVAGARVSVIAADAPALADEISCSPCPGPLSRRSVLTGPDGSFEIPEVVPGTWNLVTGKGQFRRQRALQVWGAAEQQVPEELTTLPAEDSPDGLDRAPLYAVALNNWDLAHNLLAKLGLGELDAEGNLVFGTEGFDLYNDDLSQTGYPESTEIFESLDAMAPYQMIFMPCTASHLKAAPYGYLDEGGKQPLIREYVAAGGTLYGTCYAYDWVEQPFPDYIEFPGDDWIIGDATHGSWDGQAVITDPAMREWLQVVTVEDVDAFPISGAWVHARDVAVVADGMGPPETGGAVTPTAWVTATDPEWKCPPGGCPLTVTYGFGCGQVFFSGFHVVESESSVQFRPQEQVLAYLVLAAGCR